MLNIFLVQFWDVSERNSPSVKLLWADRDGKTDSSYTDEFTALQATLDADYETVVAEF